MIATSFDTVTRVMRDDAFRASAAGQALAVALTKLREHDPALARDILVATLDDEEREVLAKMTAGAARPPPPLLRRSRSPITCMRPSTATKGDAGAERSGGMSAPARPKVGGKFFAYADARPRVRQLRTPGSRYEPLNLVLCEDCLGDVRAEMRRTHVRKLDAVGLVVIASHFSIPVCERLVRRA